MRRRRPEKRVILPDTKYNDLNVAKFINYIMKNGKKGTAESIIKATNAVINFLCIASQRCPLVYTILFSNICYITLQEHLCQSILMLDALEIMCAALSLS